MANALVKKHTFDSGLKHLLLKCDIQVKVNPTRLNMGSNNVKASSSLPCDVTRITELTANFKFTSIYCNTCWKKSSLAFITVEQALQLKSLQFKLSQTFLESRTPFCVPISSTLSKVSKTSFLTQEIRIIHFSRILIHFKNI